MKNPKKPLKRIPVTEMQWSENEIISAIEESLGSVADAARILKAERTSIYVYIKRFPKIREALDKVRADYSEKCRELARDNHLTSLIKGEAPSTAYELNKMDPKPLGQSIDVMKLTDKELASLRALLEKGKPDGSIEQSL